MSPETTAAARRAGDVVDASGESDQAGVAAGPESIRINGAEPAAARKSSRHAPALEVEIEQRSPMPLAGAFDCAAGELLALVGPSGAGKTSALRVLAGLMRPERGRVVVGGEVWCDTARGICLPPQQRHVGLVFQHYALMPHLSAEDNVALSLLDSPRAQRRAEARRWLEHVRLEPALHARRPSQLSGGQQQRVAIARALARTPRLLLLDEPFSAVDQMNRRGLYQLLADLRRELAVPIVLVTHDLQEARLLADRLVVMDGGEVLQQGTPEAIHRAPRNARVADLVGIANRFHGRWLGPDGATGLGRLRWLGEGEGEGVEAGAGVEDASPPVLLVRDKCRIATGQAVHWVLPGDGLSLHDAGEPGPDRFAATVIEARHLGEITLATLALPAVPGARVQMTLTGPGRSRAVVGRQGLLQLDLALVHVMPLKAR